jgi:integrase
MTETKQRKNRGHGEEASARRSTRKKSPDGAGSISFDAKQGVWVGRVMVGYRLDGKPDRRKVKAKTEKACLQKLDELRAKASRGMLPERDKGNATVEQFLRVWLDATRPTVKASTFKRYDELVNVHLIPGLGRHRLTALRPDHVVRFYAAKLEQINPNTARNGKLGRPYSASTVHHMHAALHRSLDRATVWGYVARNVADAVDPPRVPKPEIQPPSLDQLAQLMDVAQRSGDRLAALWTLAVYSGARQGELLALRWSDLDLNAGTMAIRRAVERGAKGHSEIGETKTKNARRSLTLPGEAVAALHGHCVRQNEERERVGEGWGVEDLVFTSIVGTRLDQRNVIRLFKAALDRAGLPKSTRFHDLRHASGSIALAAGVDLKVISRRLGHSTITITADLYTHVVNQLDIDAAELMQRALRGGNGGQLAP